MVISGVNLWSDETTWQGQTQLYTRKKEPPHWAWWMAPYAALTKNSEQTAYQRQRVFLWSHRSHSCGDQLGYLCYLYSNDLKQDNNIIRRGFCVPLKLYNDHFYSISPIQLWCILVLFRLFEVQSVFQSAAHSGDKSVKGSLWYIITSRSIIGEIPPF